MVDPTKRKEHFSPPPSRPRESKESVHSEKKKSIHIPRVFPFIYKAVTKSLCGHIYPMYYDIAYAISPSTRTLCLATYSDLIQKLVSSV